MYKTWTKYVFALCLGIVLTLSGATAQTVQKMDTVYYVTDSVRVYFPVNRSVFDFSYRNNGSRIDTVLTHLRRVRKNKKVRLDHVAVTSSSSPEGPQTFNEKLSRDRVMAIAEYLKKNYSADSTNMELESYVVDWDRFMRLVESDTSIPQKEKIKELIRKKDLDGIRNLKGTPEWDFLMKYIFPFLRTSFAVFHYSVLLNQIDPNITEWEGMEEDLAREAAGKSSTPDTTKQSTKDTTARDIPVIVPDVENPDITQQEEIEIQDFQNIPDSLPHVEKLAVKVMDSLPLPVVQLTDNLKRSGVDKVIKQKAKRRFNIKWNPWEENYDDFVQDPDREWKRWRIARHESYIKTNVFFYPLLIPNLGYEWRPLNKLSFGAQGYYSALNWFSPNTKFRVLGLQAGGRYWFRDNMYGPFAGVHFTFGWYNVAWGGDYRYQDHKGQKPAYGTGITLGYKVPVMPKLNRGRMGLEFTIGYGVMPLHYDIYNNVDNGRLVGENKMVYWGIDNASINFVYRFAGNRNLKWWREDRDQ